MLAHPASTEGLPEEPFFIRNSSVRKTFRQRTIHFLLMDWSGYLNHESCQQELKRAGDESQISAVNMVNKIQAVFGLNEVQTAAIIGVSKETFRNHISNDSSVAQNQAYKELYNLALKIEEKVKISLKPGLKSVLVNGKTLLAHLKNRENSEDKIIKVAIEVSKKILLANRVSLSVSQQRRVSHRVSQSGN